MGYCALNLLLFALVLPAPAFAGPGIWARLRSWCPWSSLGKGTIPSVPRQPAIVEPAKPLVAVEVPNAPIRVTYGMEVEYRIQENPNLVDLYRPAKLTEAEWLAMTRDKRIEYWTKNFAKPTGKKHKDAFVRLSGAPKELPETAEREIDGNVEFNGVTFHNIEEAKAWAKVLEKHIGAGSWQGHVVQDQRRLPGAAGYTIFESDRAQLNTLERNYERYLVDNSAVPGKNLTHHSLGPLGENTRTFLLDAENRVNSGEPIGRGNENRTIYGPALRSDPYGDGKMGHEQRQYHKRLDDLLADMDHLGQRLAQPQPLQPYKQFDQVKLLSDDLPKERAKALGMELHPNFRNYFNQLGEYIRRQVPVVGFGSAPMGQRFFFPLRDWENHPLVEALPEPKRTEVRERIRRATTRYLNVLNNFVKGKSINDYVVKNIQILNGEWAHTVKLSELFDEYRAKTPVPDETTLPKPPPPFLAPPPFAAQAFQFPGTDHVFPQFRFDPAKVATPEYQQFLANSVEVVYSPKGDFGHITLRVGNQFYSVNQVRSADAGKDFTPRFGMPGKKGFVYTIPPEKMQAAQKEMKLLYESVAKYNMPPFDAYAARVQVTILPDGKVRYDSPTKNQFHRAAPDGEAKLVEADGKYFLESPNGARYPVEKDGDKFYLNALSCATSATYVLGKHFDIKIEGAMGAKTLAETFQKGTPGSRPADATIDYGQQGNDDTGRPPPLPGAR